MLGKLSLPGPLIVTTHLNLLSSSEANSVVLFARAVVATAVAEVTDCIGCLHAGVEAQPTKSGRLHPHRIFFCALDALAVDDRGSRARLASGGFPALHVERRVDALERAVPTPKVEVIVERRGPSGRRAIGKPVLRTYIRPLTTWRTST